MDRIAVIGAGITGATTAYELQTRGYEVVLIDRHRYAAMETSFANGGQLSASNAEVWNSVGTLIKGMKWMLKGDAPLLLNPRLSWHKYSWLAEFIGAIRHHKANTMETTRLAIAARARLFDLAQREGIDFDLRRQGILHIYRDADSFVVAARANAMMVAAGLDRHPVTPEEMRAIEPALHGAYHGGFYTPSDSTGDIHKFTRGLTDAAVRHGTRLMLGTEVTGLTHADGGIAIDWRAEGETGRLMVDKVVICAGIASRRFAAMLGDRVNVYPVKGYSITVHLDDAVSQAAAPQVSLLDEATKIVTSRLGTDRFRVAGTAEFNGENRDIRMDRIRPLTRWTEELFPGVSTARVVPWAGLRPMMPDMMPKVGAGRRPGVFYNTGHGHLGWTLSAATAEMLAGAVEAASPRRAPARLAMAA